MNCVGIIWPTYIHTDQVMSATLQHPNIGLGPCLKLKHYIFVFLSLSFWLKLKDKETGQYHSIILLPASPVAAATV